MPPNFDVRRLDLTHDLNLINMLGYLLQQPAEYSVKTDHIDICFRIPVSAKFISDEISQLPTDEDDLGYYIYNQWVNREIEERQYESKMSRGAFCEHYLNAKMANPRWSWVGVKEPKKNKKGALFLFAWEHDFDFSNLSTQVINLFPSELSNLEGRRRHPGHRDALDNIERVLRDELTPYIVWQKAKDKTSERPALAGIVIETANECTLKKDAEDNWTAVVGKTIAL